MAAETPLSANVAATSKSMPLVVEPDATLNVVVVVVRRISGMEIVAVFVLAVVVILPLSAMNEFAAPVSAPPVKLRLLIESLALAPKFNRPSDRIVTLAPPDWN